MIVVLWTLVCPRPGWSSGREIVNAWCLDLVNASDDLGAGAYAVKVALVDSGVRVDGSRFAAAKISEGHNYVFEDTSTSDLVGHGSSTAAIILGATSGGLKITGLGSQASLVPLVFITKYPSGVEANGGVHGLSSAIVDAVDKYGCRVINVSSGIRTDDPELRSAVEYAEEKGTIVVSAAGNHNLSSPAEVFYPANYPTVVAVGSVDKDKIVSDFSQRNPGVTVVAPGEQVPSIAKYPEDGFTVVSGTSYSAAYVTGFAVQVLSRCPDITPAEFRGILMESCLDLGEPGYDTSYGYGLIDVSAGLTLAAQLHKTTRAEFVALLAKLSGDALPPVDGTFADVDPSHPFAQAVAWGAKVGIGLGYGGRFRPDERITRQDMAVMLIRFAERDKSCTLQENELTFTDEASISGYARGSVAKAVAEGILKASPAGEFHPLVSVAGVEAQEACENVRRVMEEALSGAPR